jgi:hypothetical protein
MKGPMTTQSLRGMAGTGPLHWRGDKTGGLTTEGVLDPEGDWQDENAALLRFNAAFTGLQGRAEPLGDADMQTFADFMLQLRYPPNPVKRLDNRDTAAETKGLELFTNNQILPPLLPDEQACIACHALPLTTSGFVARDATRTADSAQDTFKIPQLRNMYQKVGMFGAAAGALLGQPEYLVGEQVRGFGYLNDGSISTIDMLLHHPTNFLFPLLGLQGGLTVTEQRANLQAFILSIDTGLKPIVGQQLTIAAGSLAEPAVQERLDLLLARAEAGDAELVVKGVWDGAARGALYRDGQWQLDRADEPPLATTDLLAMAEVPDQSLSFTAVPPGNGERIGIDRDLDGVLDGNEKSAEPAPVDDADHAGSLGAGLLLMFLILSGRRHA